eukprot:TRINITY_DN14073_c0_g1_i1.p1 TRINITY_DN14073_c0_g1~~TRINITY_DN14073_c0_g1_i1.p1  ORF type:complete len:303 (+),score=80.50 TRINITY_DN14073_c0_g1_i1:102-1010(+)
MLRSLVGSEMCIRDRYQRRVRGTLIDRFMAQSMKSVLGPLAAMASCWLLRRWSSGGSGRAPMVLWSSLRSNFAARVRYTIYANRLEKHVVIKNPGGKEGSVGGGACSLPAATTAEDDTFMRAVRARNAIGKIPLLVLPDGAAIPESQIIVEFLERRFESPAKLLPHDPESAARAQLVARIHDVYMGSHFLPCLFRELSPEQTELGLRWIHHALDALEGLHPGGERFFVQDRVTVADIAVAPTVVYMLVSGEKLKGGTPFFNRPKLKDWWACMMRDVVWQRVYAEMESMFPQNTEEHMFCGRV